MNGWMEKILRSVMCVVLNLQLKSREAAIVTSLNEQSFNKIFFFVANEESFQQYPP